MRTVIASLTLLMVAACNPPAKPAANNTATPGKPVSLMSQPGSTAFPGEGGDAAVASPPRTRPSTKDQPPIIDAGGQIAKSGKGGG